MKRQHLRNVSILLGFFAFLALAVGLRVSLGHVWFPAAPNSIGEWTMAEVPLGHDTLEMLGSPHADGYRFTNPYGERVDSHVIATETYAAYHEPEICMSGYGYQKTAYETLYPFGPERPVRGLVLKNLTSSERVIMYYWIQYKDGRTALTNELALHEAILPRFAVGWEKVLHSQPSCIVRAYIVVNPADRNGLQARRDLETVCQGLYNTLKSDGAKS